MRYEIYMYTCIYVYEVHVYYYDTIITIRYEIHTIPNSPSTWKKQHNICTTPTTGQNHASVEDASTIHYGRNPFVL